MESAIESPGVESSAEPPSQVTDRPARVAQFSHDFWNFYAAAFLFDFGIGLFFFLFNLFLTDLHFNEKSIGQITGALTLGNVLGTIPAMLLVRRFGLRTLLLVCFIGTPIACALRTFFLWPEAQLALALLTGAVMCAWPICFSPTIAKLTDESNRVRGFSMMFATGIGLGTVAGLVGGYLPEILQKTQHQVSIVGGIRSVLLLACVAVLLGALPLLRLHVESTPSTAQRRIRIFHPYLLYFLPPFLVWNIVTGSFPPFAAVYLQQNLHIPLRNVGLIFSGSQLAQFAAVLAAPFLFRRLGLIPGIAIAQVATGLLLFSLGGTHATSLAVVAYLGYTSVQWMSGPGIYSLLMNNVPDEERSTASALQNMSGAICQAATAAVTGTLIVKLGYSSVLFDIGWIALGASGLFFALLRQGTREAGQFPKQV